MAPLLALLSAACYGVVDFAGGLLSRRIPFTAVTLLGQLGGLLVAVIVALLVPASSVRPADLGWGAVSGVGSAAAMLCLNRGLSRGAMTVVVPVSAVTSVVLSVLTGVVFLGDRPTLLAWAGIAATGPALWLVSGGHVIGPRRRGGENAKGTADGLLASAGVAVQYLALAQAGAASGLWPVAAGRLAAVVVLLPSAARHLRVPPLRGAQALLIGAGAALGLSLYLLATRQQMLAIAVVLASLYPALPVVLGLIRLHERVDRRQMVGLVGTAAASVLLAVG
ncbi:EamA family transporter [Streptomyces sp. VRA16 Mangrove soil]|uniref:EamA family transporter n=1 Tax=Streptomyces sp. VRA16 Mangrove soil TaxID=2817434 RepID=UPI001A9E12AD|nr:EamA family transporter [Streptomyces sp. VRA16 Mangrove soil]MBO1330496.1 DMT family transporter [Streptomyces sp. VRA16 Mangrove soil]